MNRDSNNDQRKYYDQYGQPVDQYGRPVDKNGIAYADYVDGEPPRHRKPSQGRNGTPGVKKVSAPKGWQKTKSSNTRSSQTRSSQTRPSQSRSSQTYTKTQQTTKKRPTPAKKSKKKTKKRRLPIFRIILVIFIVMIGAVVWHINHLLDLYTYDDTNESSISQHTQKGIMTMALFGVDTREDGESGTRSDAMMIMSVDPKRSSIKLISLMRDSYVDVPGHGKTKLCHAYGYESDGGPQLVLDTINKNYDMDITEYMTVDFGQMASIIDAVGGVTITLTKDEVKETNKFIDEYCWSNNMPTQRIEGSGEQQLNGIQAMTYGRIRKGNTGGDWMRTERQSMVLNQVFEKATHNPITMLKFLEGLMPNITSSMSKSDFWYMGLKTILHGMPTMDHIRLPLDDEWEYGYSSGMSVIKFSDDVLTEHLHEYIFDDIKPKAE